MTEGDAKPLSADELAKIDAEYQSFPSFSDWPREVPRERLWDVDHQLFLSVAADATAVDLEKAQEIALRTAAFDTGAIEGLYSTDRGLTFTVATQAAAWEQKVSERSDEALDLFRAQLAGFELVLDLATDRFPQVTQALIRRLHEEVTAPQATYVVHTPVGPQEQPLPKGEYKRYPNHVRTADGGIHAYSPVELTSSEMQRLMDELASQEFEAAHPLLQASYAHYALSVIHPFADGNGRVARAIASAYTYRAASIPLVVQAHDRDRYLADLATADKGDPDPFIDFISKAARDGLEMVTESLEAAKGPQPEELLAEFKELLLAQGELTHHELDGIANDFAAALVETAVEQVGSLSAPSGVEISVGDGSGGNNVEPPAGFRRMVDPGPRFLTLNFKASAPAAASVELYLDIFVSTESDPSTTVLVFDGSSQRSLIVGLSDLQPQLSSAARFRVESYLRRMIGYGLDWLLQKSRKQLQQRGYKN